MPLSANDLVILRSWVPWVTSLIPPAPTDAYLSDRYDVLGTWQEVALEAVRRKRSELLANPSSFSVDSGEYSESWGDTIRALGEREKQLQAMIPAGESEDSMGMAVGSVERYGRGRSVGGFR